MPTTIQLKSRRNALQIQALKIIEPELRATDQTWRRKYLRDFVEAFPTYENVIFTQELDQRIADSSLVLIGDYHALPACQQFAGNLINQNSSKRPVVLAVETVFSRDQHILDQWWKQSIGEQELRRRIRFNQDWGYDWQPFYDLLLTARKCADAVYGLDCMPREDLRKINARDRHAAHKLAEIRKRHPSSLIVTLIGESHLAPSHLPALIQKHLPKENRLTILQNVDPLHWRAQEENQKVEAVSVNESTICVFNTTPLEKYENYQACLNRWREEGWQDRDFAPAVYSNIDALLRFLDINRYSPTNGRQPRFLIDLFPEVRESGDAGGMRFSDNQRHRLDNFGCAYVHQHNAFVIQQFQAKAVAGEAGRFIHHACRGVSSGNCDHSQMLEDALAYFGSQILCENKSTLYAGSEWEALGAGLYQAFQRGILSRADLKQTFLAPAKHAAKLCSHLSAKCGLGILT